MKRKPLFNFFLTWLLWVAYSHNDKLQNHQQSTVTIVFTEHYRLSSKTENILTKDYYRGSRSLTRPKQQITLNLN